MLYQLKLNKWGEAGEMGYFNMVYFQVGWNLLRKRLDGNLFRKLWKWWLNLGWRCLPSIFHLWSESSEKKLFDSFMNKSAKWQWKIPNLRFYLYYIKFPYLIKSGRIHLLIGNVTLFKFTFFYSWLQMPLNQSKP